MKSIALQIFVDARTAKPGQEVTARVTKDVKQDGRVVLHKGDRLVGRITSVEASDKANAGSRISVDFDRMASGQTTSQLNTVVTSVLSARGGSASEEPTPAGPAMTAPPPSMGGGSSGGGGGLGGGLAGGLTSTVGSAEGVAGSRGRKPGRDSERGRSGHGGNCCRSCCQPDSRRVPRAGGSGSGAWLHADHSSG